MKNIEAILNEHAADVSEEVRAAIAKDVRANYKTLAEWTKKTDRISELESKIADLTEAAGKLEGSTAELEELKAKVKSFEDAEAKRKADEDAEKAKAAFKTQFDAAVGERKFANELIAEVVFDKAYKDCTANAGKSAKDAIEEATRDMGGVWSNPQRDPFRMPTPEQVSTKSPDADEAKRSFAAMLFGPQTKE